MFISHMCLRHHSMLEVTIIIGKLSFFQHQWTAPSKVSTYCIPHFRLSFHWTTWHYQQCWNHCRNTCLRHPSVCIFKIFCFYIAYFSICSYAVYSIAVVKHASMHSGKMHLSSQTCVLPLPVTCTCTCVHICSELQVHSEYWIVSVQKYSIFGLLWIILLSTAVAPQLPTGCSVSEKIHKVVPWSSVMVPF